MMKKTGKTKGETIDRWKELHRQAVDLLKTFTVESAQAADLLKAFEVESARIEKIARDAREYAKNIVDTVREPLVVLDKNLRIVFSQPLLLPEL